MHRLAVAALAACLVVPFVADAANPPRVEDPLARRGFVTSLGSSRVAKAPVDTVTLYGGPGTLQGKFETATGGPDWQGWTSVDLSGGDSTPYWQHSTFNAGNLNSHGVGNHAMWCGQTAEQQPDYVAGTGYGRMWNTSLIWTSGPLSDPSAGQTVALDFVFNCEFEPGYDYLHVEYELAGVWTPTMSVTGTNKLPDDSFPTPGVLYADEKTAEITFAGNDYGGLDGDEIRLRIRFTSDGAFDDETGLWPTDAGAAQVDDLHVQWTDGGAQSQIEDFEGTAPFAWMLEPPPVAGDFAKPYPGLGDRDTCTGNPSVQLCFLDDGTPPGNGGGWSTGGTTSVEFSYGISGGYVVNHTGGLSEGRAALWNEAWSPPIAWDLPGSGDDLIDGAAFLEFDVWTDLPNANGIFYVWHVRASEDDGATWSEWADRNVVYKGLPTYRRDRHQIRDLLPPSPTHLQVALGVRDMTDIFYLPGGDATPAPYFDNVKLEKLAAGPQLVVDARHLFQDSFPPSGLADPITDPKGLNCRFDSSIDLIGNADLLIILPGDSLVVAASALVPGGSVQRVELHWLLDVNPLFAGVRDMPPGTAVSPGAGVFGWDRWTGTVSAVKLPATSLRPDDWFVDMPYEGPGLALWQPDGPETMFFPGDRFRYYLEAEDDQGRVSTAPRNLNGFDSGMDYDDRFDLRALPSWRDDGGALVQPALLFVDSAGRSSPSGASLASTGWPAEDPRLDGSYEQMLGENGLVEGLDYDHYQVLLPEYELANGIGSSHAHGATLEQLSGYSSILFTSGEDIYAVLGDEGYNRKGSGRALLCDWLDAAGDRSLAVFGDHFAQSLYTQLNGSSFLLRDRMGVAYQAGNFDVSGVIGDQRSPDVLPVLGGFTTSFTVVAGCNLPLGGIPFNSFDEILPYQTAVFGHGFQVAAAPGTTYMTAAASVVWDRLAGEDRKATILFPYDLQSVWDSRQGDPHARAALLAEVLDYMQPGWTPSGPATATGTPHRPGILGLAAVPNPFNPCTTVRFSVGRSADYRVEILDVRGRRVRTLFSGPLAAGAQAIAWDGTDGSGSDVASGVYVIRVDGDGSVQKVKASLLK